MGGDSLPVLLVRLEELERRMDLQFAAADRATVLALSDLNKRLEGMNEFRQALRDQTASFMSRTEFDAQHSGVLKEIKALELSKATLEGKASQASTNLALAIAIAGLLLSVFATGHKWMTP